VRRPAPRTWLAVTGLLAVTALAGSLAAGGPLRTDTSKALVPLEEIVSGGPPPDGIPAIDRPTFVRPADADGWLTPKEPVIALEIRGDARAYPLQILMWHEIVNDVVGGLPVTVTYCPLCNSGIVSRDTGHSRPWGSWRWAGSPPGGRPGSRSPRPGSASPGGSS
jgi:hypothetical protein